MYYHNNDNIMKRKIYNKPFTCILQLDSDVILATIGVGSLPNQDFGGAPRRPKAF